MMRRINSIITGAMMLTFLIHAISGAFMMLNIMEGGSMLLIVATNLFVILAFIHILIGAKLTADSLRTIKKSGVYYFRENLVFWARRVSGFAIILFMVFHVLIFAGRSEDGFFRLNLFGSFELVISLVFVVCLAIHIISNINPLLISLGIPSLRKYSGDILFVLSVVMLFCAAGFIGYYILWIR